MAQTRRSHLYRNPLFVVGIAFAGLMGIVEYRTDPLGLRLRNASTRSAAEAADLSLERLMASRLSQRLQREGHLNNLPAANRATIDRERDRIRAHPLYVAIKAELTNQLLSEGYA